MKTKLFVIVLSSILLISSCSYPATSTPAGQIAETEQVQATSTSEAVPTLPSTTEPAPVIAAVASPYVPFYSVTQVDNLVLRANPGPLFEAKTTLPNASRLLVLGRAPGSEWLLVQTPLERTGWVFSQFVTSEGDLKLVPLIQPADMQVVRGRVLDENGKPITGIQFAVVQDKAGTPPRNDAITDETGTFYAFMPVNTTGTWAVSFTAIACTSNRMDKDCKCLNGVCGGPIPASISVTLPLDQSLEFLWK
jgi:hypothetical protein